MFNTKLANCPVCGQPMEHGFCARTQGLSWIPAAKLKQFVFIDKDLNEAGLRKFLPSSAEYDLSYHCAGCKLYIVDYSRAVSSAEAKALAHSST